MTDYGDISVPDNIDEQTILNNLNILKETPHKVELDSLNNKINIEQSDSMNNMSEVSDIPIPGLEDMEDETSPNNATDSGRVSPLAEMKSFDEDKSKSENEFSDMEDNDEASYSPLPRMTINTNTRTISINKRKILDCTDENKSNQDSHSDFSSLHSEDSLSNAKNGDLDPAHDYFKDQNEDGESSRDTENQEQQGNFSIDNIIFDDENEKIEEMAKMSETEDLDRDEDDSADENEHEIPKENINGSDIEGEKSLALENGEVSNDSADVVNGDIPDNERTEEKNGFESSNLEKDEDGDDTESMESGQVPSMIVAGAGTQTEMEGEEEEEEGEGLNLMCEDEEAEEGVPYDKELQLSIDVRNKTEHNYIKSPEKLFELAESPGSGRKKYPNMNMDLLCAPFDCGWRREVVIRGVFDEYTKAGKPKKIPADVYYFTPEGTKLRSHNQIEQYLLKTQETELSNDNFSFLKKPIFKAPGEIVRHANAARGRAQSKNRPEVVIERDSDGVISPLHSDTPIGRRIGRPPKKSLPRKGRPPGRRIGRTPQRYVDQSPESVSPYDQRGRGRPPKRKIEDILSAPLPPTTPVKLESDPVVTTGAITKSISSPALGNESFGSTPPPVKKQKATARKSTTQKSFTQSVHSPTFSDGFIAPIENLCGMNCPGLEGIAPTLHCAVCMCMFHPKCVNHDVLSGQSFTCLRCCPNRKTPKSSASNGLMTVPAPGMLGSLLLMQNNANKIEPKRDSASPNFDLSKVKVEPGLEKSELENALNFNGSHARPDVRQETLGSLRTILDKRVDTVPKTSAAQFAPLVIGNHGTMLQNVCLPQGPHMIHARTSAPQLPVGAIRMPSANPIITGPASILPSSVIQTPPGGGAITTTQLVSLVPPKVTQAVTNVTISNAPLSSVTTPSSSVVPLENMPMGELGSPQTSLTPFRNGQLLTLPSAVTKRLNLQQPLALKINNMQIVVPPSCFLSTPDGLKVFLPPKTFPVQTGMTAQLSVTVSNNKPSDETGNLPKVVTDVEGSTEIQNNSSEKKTPPKERKKLVFKSGLDLSACFMKQLYGGFDCMLHIFKYLNIRDLARSGRVCRSWHRLTRQPCLYKRICLRDIAVKDWQKMVEFLSSLRPESLDLKGLKHEDDRNRTWQKLVSSVHTLSTLRQLHFGLVPASVVQIMCDKMRQLEVFTAEWISDISDDQMWTTPTKIDIGKFGLLTNLRELRLRGVGGLSLPAFCFNGGITELANLKSLELLSLTSLKSVQGTEFTFLTEMKNLSTLELGDCVSWTAETYEQLSRLTSLKCLRLECGGEIPDVGLGAALEPMKNLEQLELIMFLIADSLASTLSKLEALKTLVLWPDTTPHAALVNSNTLSVVSKLTQLKKLEWGIVGNKNNSIILDSADGSSVSSKTPVSPNANEQVEWVPFLPETDNNDPRSPENLAEYIGVHQLKQRLCTSLPDTDINVFSTQVLSARNQIGGGVE